MNPFNLLKEDHKKVKALFKSYEGQGERAFQKKQAIADLIFDELEVHTQVEEEIFYPAIDAAAKKEEHQLVAEAFEEHRLVKQLIEELRELEDGDDDFQAKFKVMRENVEHHVKEEENELFPQAKKLIADQEEELGEQMQLRKEELQEEKGMEGETKVAGASR